MNLSWLDNGFIKLGVNLDLGGSITFLAENGRGNLINSHDWGRQVQMSFYSGPAPYIPEGKEIKDRWMKLGWNPIQSGDVFGNRSKILCHRNSGNEIYVKCIPMHWPLNNAPGECTFETWYSLEGNAVRVKCRLANSRNNDKTQYTARSQELPAVYTNGPWYKLVSYTGSEPFTNSAPDVLVDKHDGKGWPWIGFMATENWAALLDDNNYGLGVVHPGVYNFIGGFSGPKGQGGPQDPPTGYVSPVCRDIIDWNIVYDYSYYLYVGKLDDIRKYAVTTASEASTASTPPVYVFNSDRQHWTYNGIVDSGWPIVKELNFNFGSKDGSPSVMIGPKCFFKAEDAPVLYLLAAFRTTADSLVIDFEKFNKDNGTASVPLKIKGDGVLRVYEVNLTAQCKQYTGIITGTRIRFPGNEGDARIKVIAFDLERVKKHFS